MSLPRPKKPKEVDFDWTKAATLRPNRKATATIKRLSGEKTRLLEENRHHI